jgi:hypothetical protein
MLYANEEPTNNAQNAVPPNAPQPNDNACVPQPSPKKPPDQPPNPRHTSLVFISLFLQLLFFFYLVQSLYLLRFLPPTNQSLNSHHQLLHSKRFSHTIVHSSLQRRFPLFLSRIR